MTAFLITSPKGVSEWKESFNDVQSEMISFEKQGVFSNVNVSKFENNVMVKSFTYDFNGLNWEKR